VKFSKIIIIAQQETLRERPRIHKQARILQSLGQPFEIWKVGEKEESSADGLPVRNLMTNQWRKRSALLRYAIWMLAVFVQVLREQGKVGFIAVGFDSSFPLSWFPFRMRPFMLDNVDNIAMSYRMPNFMKVFFTWLERWVAFRAIIHCNPSRDRWTQGGKNLRVIVNTPARAAVNEAKRIAQERRYERDDSTFTLYVNGWLSPTRGLGTLVRALERLRDRGIAINIVVAGRPACPDAEELLKWPRVQNMGMLKNDEALAVYFKCHLAYVYYDPSIEINRLAESQKWTDCWATETPFVSNSEILTLDRFTKANACYTLGYEDDAGLADLIERLQANPASTRETAARLAAMDFKFWDDEMRNIVLEWIR
jgi:glycosyltransferase involved in cell wall biosynthesis